MKEWVKATEVAELYSCPRRVFCRAVGGYVDFRRAAEAFRAAERAEHLRALGTGLHEAWSRREVKASWDWKRVFAALGILGFLVLVLLMG